MAIVVAVLLAVSGGIRVTVGGFRVSARSPLVPGVVAIALVAAWAWFASRRGAATRDLIDAWTILDRSAWTIVVGIAAASAGAAVLFGTFAATGADASGYLSQAGMWASGRFRLPDALSLMPKWPPDPGLSAPLGWSASLERGWQVPTYGPGLPLLMAIPHAFGGPLAACLASSIAAAIAVLATSAIALRLAGAAAAIASAVTLATCPAFIVQSVQPMSDLPATAAWMACWAALSVPAPGSRHPASPLTLSALAGIACAVAVLIRPNLAPLAIVPLIAVFVFLRNANSETRIATGVLFALPVALAAVLLGWLHWQWYGSPFRSGYGTAGQLFAWSNVWPNASRYATWVMSTAPVLLMALVGIWIRRGPLTWALAVFALFNVSAYLVYFVFDDWGYLRFLLPAVAVAAVFVGVTIAALLNRLPLPARAGLLLAAMLAMAVVGLSRTRALDGFRLTDVHRRVLQIDRYLSSALPDRAVVVAGEQSGAVRFDTGHEIIRWEAASVEGLNRALEVLKTDRRPVWVLLDVWEEPLVRDKFRSVTAAALDWPPAVEAGDTHRTRAWNLADRERYLRGERVVTDRLR